MQRVNIAVASGSARCQQPHIFLTNAFDLAKPETDRLITASLIFQRVIPLRFIDIHRANLNAVLPGIADDLRRCVKAHRLTVEKRGAK
nr:hypothetical protein [Nitrobacter vulgaris]